MCGLAGVARLGGGHLDDGADDLLRRMAAAVAHRGPDDVRLLREGPVGLAFTRLSLVDVVGGGQPLTSADGTLTLIANGEVWNHRELAASLRDPQPFATRSDCEVLLQLYRERGDRFLDDVRGMAAVALWDRARGRLVLARDRFGVKPLFVHRDADRVVFGSEMKALFCDRATPREVDWLGALRDQTMTKEPAFTEDRATSWFTGIDLVEAGTVVTIDLATGSTSTRRHWQPPRHDGGLDLGEDEFVAAYRELLASAVDDCCMADVEIGLFLSGGVDSAAVAALASRRGPLRTFTALNGATLVNGDAEHGSRIARQLGLPNTLVLHDTAQTPTADEWKRLVWLLESPLTGPEVFYKHELYRHVRLAQPQLKAMLLGAGSDEYNGGYSVGIAQGGGWDGYLANLGEFARREALHRDPRLAAWWQHSDLPLLRDDVLPRDDRDAYERLFAWKHRDVLQYNCWHEDRTAAGNGIEARVPFLDHRLVELVAGIPAALRERLVWDKAILRRAVADVLPPGVATRAKVPFFYGDGVGHTYRAFARMLLADGGALIDEALSGPQAKEHVDADNVRALAARIARDPAAGHVEFLLHVVNLGLLEQLAASPPAPPSVGRATTPPESITVTDWDAERAAIEARTVVRPAVDPATVPALADDVLLLHAPADPATWYVVVGGEIAYVVDEAESPTWARFLLGVDGERTVADLAGPDLDAVAADLADCLDSGLLVRVAP